MGKSCYTDRPLAVGGRARPCAPRATCAPHAEVPPGTRLTFLVAGPGNERSALPVKGARFFRLPRVNRESVGFYVGDAEVV